MIRASVKSGFAVRVEAELGKRYSDDSIERLFSHLPPEAIAEIAEIIERYGQEVISAFRQEEAEREREYGARVRRLLAQKMTA